MEFHPAFRFLCVRIGRQVADSPAKENGVKRALGCRLVALLAAVLVGLVDARAVAAETLRIGGTGAALELMREIGNRFEIRSGIRVEIVPGLGSSGGIRGVAEGVLALSVSGRPLKPEESQRGLVSEPFGRSPFGFVTSHSDPDPVKSDEVAALFEQIDPRWSDGTPLRVILRPPADSDTELLRRYFPGMAAALEQAYTRHDVPRAPTDDDALYLVHQIPGSLVGATLTHVRLREPQLRFVAIDGRVPSLAGLEEGTYPYVKEFRYVHPADPQPQVLEFLRFIRSAEGTDVLRLTGNLPVEPL